jgi:hypothetical protein
MGLHLLRPMIEESRHGRKKTARGQSAPKKIEEYGRRG